MSWEQWLKENTNTVEETEYRLNESNGIESGFGTLKNDSSSINFTHNENGVKDTLKKGTPVSYDYNKKTNKSTIMTTDIKHGDHVSHLDGHFSNHINENEGETTTSGSGTLKNDMKMTRHDNKEVTVPKGTNVIFHHSSIPSIKYNQTRISYHTGGELSSKEPFAIHSTSVHGHHSDFVDSKSGINESNTSGWQQVGSQYGKPQLKHDTTLYDSHGSPTVIAKGKHVEVSYHADKDMTSLSHTPDNRGTPSAMGHLPGHFTKHVH